METRSISRWLPWQAQGDAKLTKVLQKDINVMDYAY